jgi:predicted RNase H-like HicB family nuclease
MVVGWYDVILIREAQGGYSILLPAFRHGHTQGDTVAEALGNAMEVIELEADYARRSSAASTRSG